MSLLRGKQLHVALCSHATTGGAIVEVKFRSNLFKIGVNDDCKIVCVLICKKFETFIALLLFTLQEKWFHLTLPGRLFATTPPSC